MIGNVTVTNCTTAGYNAYTLDTPNNIGLGGALAHGNVITFACNAALSGGAGPYTIVPQNAAGNAATTITIAGGAVTIDGSDGGAHDVTISGGGAITIFSVSAGATLNLTTLTVANAKANIGLQLGGGVYVAGTLHVDSSTFQNSAAVFGGAIGADFGSVVTVANSTIVSNSSTGGNGGAIESAATSLTISNSTFVNNHAAVSGGAVNLFGGSATITNSTFDGNTAAGGGGALNISTGLSYTLANTIRAGNTSGAPPVSADCGAPITTDNGGNLADDATCGFTAASSVNSSATLAASIAPLANNGGETMTQALLAGSPAIDAGLAATCEAAPINDLDQRGLPRYAVQRGDCDAGAYDTGGGIMEPLTITGAFPLTRFPAGPARLGFAASNNGTFTGVALTNFPVGYITFQLGGSLFTVRQPVLIACTSAIVGGDHCLGAMGVIQGVPQFVATPGATATITLSGIIFTGHGAFPVGALATVTLTASASATGVITVSAVSVSVNGIPQVTWTAPFPFATSIIIQASSLFIP